MDDKLVWLSDIQNRCRFIQDEHGEWILAADIIKLPAVDAVEVVRCRECRHGLYNENYGNVVCCVHHWTRGPKYYCGDGQRREEDRNAAD